MKKIIVAMLGIVCLMCTSCQKEDLFKKNWDYVWVGEFPTIAINGATDKEVEITGIITLEFEDEGNTAIIWYGFKDQYGGSRWVYEARWRGNDSFDLYPKTGEQIVKEYSGAVNRNKMSLDNFKGGAVEATYTLTKTN